MGGVDVGGKGEGGVGVGEGGAGVETMSPRMSTSMQDVKISSVYLQIQSQRKVAGPDGASEGIRTC
jgi:hypothetical protein